MGKKTQHYRLGNNSAADGCGIALLFVLGAVVVVGVAVVLYWLGIR